MLKPILISLLFASCATQVAKPSQGSRSLSEEESSRTLGDSKTIANSKFGLDGLDAKLHKGETVTKLIVSIDGYPVGECDVEHLDSSLAGHCFKDVEIEAGSHMLEADIACRNPKTLSTLGCSYYLYEYFSVKAGDSVVANLREAFTTEDPSKWFHHKSLEKDFSDCEKKWNAIANAGHCRSEQLTKALEALESSASCTDSEGAAQYLHALAQNTLGGRISSCYPDSQVASRRGGLPRMISGWHWSDAWPEGTLSQAESGWSWARMGLSKDFWSLSDAKEIHKEFVATLKTTVERQAILDLMIDGFLDKTKMSNATKAAKEMKWSMDPRTTSGHLNYVLIANKQGDASYADYVASQIVKDQSATCSYPKVSDRLLSFFRADSKLSNAEFDAIKAMVKRTDSKQEIKYCDYGFRKRPESSVSYEKRLLWLGEWECNPKNRHAALLGKQLRSHLQVIERDDKKLAKKLTSKFGKCLSK